MHADDIEARLARGEEVTFATSRLKTVGIWLGSVALTAGSIWMIVDGEQALIGWIGAVFFGLGVVVLAVQAVTSPPALVVTVQGLRTPNGPGRDAHVGWGQIASVHLGRIPAARDVTAGVIELRPGERARAGGPDGPAIGGPDAAGHYRRPDGSVPEGRIVILQGRFRGGSLDEVVATLDELVTRWRRGS